LATNVLHGVCWDNEPVYHTSRTFPIPSNSATESFYGGRPKGAAHDRI